MPYICYIHVLVKCAQSDCLIYSAILKEMTWRGLFCLQPSNFKLLCDKDYLTRSLVRQIWYCACDTVRMCWSCRVQFHIYFALDQQIIMCWDFNINCTLHPPSADRAASSTQQGTTIHTWKIYFVLKGLVMTVSSITNKLKKTQSTFSLEIWLPSFNRLFKKIRENIRFA